MRFFIYALIFFLSLNSIAQEVQTKEFSSTLDNSTSLNIPTQIPNITTTMLYYADGDTRSNLGAYSHHCALAFHKGILYAAWSNHLKDEDAPGQRVFMRFSKDKGITWIPALNEKPIELFPSLDDWKLAKEAKPEESDRAGTCNGFVEVDGRLFAVNEVLPDVSMQHAGKGRLVREINADASLGDIFWIESESPVSPKGYQAYPNMSDEKYAFIGKKIKDKLTDKSKKNLLTWDFKGKRNTSTEIVAGNLTSPLDDHNLCEPTTSFTTADGVLAVLWRDLGVKNHNQSRRLYVSYSNDNGETWCRPLQTNIPDSCSRPFAGNFPKGGAYLVNNPGKFGFGDGSRRILVLSIAKDGRHFNDFYTIRKVDNDLRFKGLYKGGFGAAYPSAIVVGGNLFVLYSINKEDIEISKIPLKDIGVKQ